jgi:hypothetical protein
MVAFSGSRVFPDDAAPAVGLLVRAALRQGLDLAVGCAVGADRAVVDAALAAFARPAAPPPARLHVFSAFGPAGLGAWRGSAVSSVQAADQVGARVAWWAGGDEQVDLKQRLACRSRAMVAALACRPDPVLVVFLANLPPPGARYGSGSWLTLRLALARGIRAFVVPVGAFAAACPAALPAPLPRGGAWVPAQLGTVTAYRWDPAAPARAGCVTPGEARAAGWRYRRLAPARPSAAMPPELARPPFWAE